MRFDISWNVFRISFRRRADFAALESDLEWAWGEISVLDVKVQEDCVLAELFCDNRLLCLIVSRSLTRMALLRWRVWRFDVRRITGEISSDWTDGRLAVVCCEWTSCDRFFILEMAWLTFLFGCFLYGFVFWCNKVGRPYVCVWSLLVLFYSWCCRYFFWKAIFEATCNIFDKSCRDLECVIWS